MPRFICESSLGVGNAVGRLGLTATFGFVPRVLPFYFWDRVRQEKSIEKKTDIDWVIVRPPMLTNGPARGNYRHRFNVGNYIWLAGRRCRFHAGAIERRYLHWHRARCLLLSARNCREIR